MNLSAPDIRLTRGLAVALVVCSAVVAGAVQQDRDSDPNEGIARQLFSDATNLLQGGKDSEAVGSFDRIVSTYGKTRVADDALLALGQYYLDVRKDPGEAAKKAAKLRTDYADRVDTVPFVWVLDGRIALAQGLTDDHFATAINSFDQAVRLFEAWKAGEAIPEARYRAAEAARLAGRGDANQRYADLIAAYPRSSWTARALLGSARALVRDGQATRAMGQLQRVRNQFPDLSTEVGTALGWNTILYRLYIRAAQPLDEAWTSNTKTTPTLQDVTGLAVAGGRVGVATRLGLPMIPLSGGPTLAAPSPDPVGLLVDGGARFWTLHDDPGALRNERGESFPIDVAFQGKAAKDLKWRAGVWTASGELLLAETGLRSIAKLSREGRTWRAGDFASNLKAERLAISDVDEVAALDDAARRIAIYNRKGTLVDAIPRDGDKYRMRDPLDVAFDAFGHVYVLDRADRATILVFAPVAGKYTYKASFLLPLRTDPGALAVGPLGGVYVFDKRSVTVRGFQ